MGQGLIALESMIYHHFDNAVFTGRASALLIGLKAAQGQKLLAKNYFRFHFDPGDVNDDDCSYDIDDDGDFNVDWIE